MAEVQYLVADTIEVQYRLLSFLKLRYTRILVYDAKISTLKTPAEKAGFRRVSEVPAGITGELREGRKMLLYERNLKDKIPYDIEDLSRRVKKIQHAFPARHHLLLMAQKNKEKAYLAKKLKNEANHS